MSNKVTGLHLSPDCVEKLKILCARSNKSMSKYVEDSIRADYGLLDLYDRLKSVKLDSKSLDH